MNKTCAIIVAAGKGSRMKSEQNKQYLEIDGIPVLARTLNAFEQCAAVDEIIVVANENELDYCRVHILDAFGFKKVKKLVPGGNERQKSVYYGLIQTDGQFEIVLIHDGARPFVSCAEIESSVAFAKLHGAACVAVLVKDTIKAADSNGFVSSTPDRSLLWQAQTPQAFKYEILIEAYKSAIRDGINGTDDCSLVERCGVKPKIVSGSYYNIKITTREDLPLAEAISGIFKLQ